MAYICFSLSRKVTTILLLCLYITGSNKITFFQVLMLTTNMIRKDLNSHNMYDSGTALTGLACFINGDLARDLANDVMTLVSLTEGPHLPT